MGIVIGSSGGILPNCGGGGGGTGPAGPPGPPGPPGPQGAGFDAITSPLDNRILTSDGSTDSAIAEVNLTFDGTTLLVTGSLVVTGSASITGSLNTKGSIIPDSDSTYTLGLSDRRWAHVYTGDLHLRNHRGDWTIVEEVDYLCVVNNLTGKKYKMMLQPIDDE